MMVAGNPSPSLDSKIHLLNITKQLYPAIVLAVFVIGFIIYGVANAPDDSDQIRVQALRGPGGRPLPFRRKSAHQVKEAAAIKDFSPLAKLVFRIGQTGVILTFIVGSVIILLQVVLYRKDMWWPGQSAIVCVFCFLLCLIY
jgi:ATP-binding cassette, subfamily B, vacuolar membrane transporter HMT1/ACLQ